MILTKFLLFLLCVSGTVALKAKSPCPFNQNVCNCTDYDTPILNSYYSVNCESADFPTFTTTDQNYSVNTMTIKSQNFKIPAHQFVGFFRIEKLSLQNPNPHSVQQQWDADAFQSVAIRQFETIGITGILPPPEALRRLGSRNLQVLSIAKSDDPGQLPNSTFESFYQLQELTIFEYPLEKIDNRAFYFLKSLNRLSIIDNGITEIPDNAFSELTNLRVLFLDSNFIGPNIETGSLDALPQSLKQLSLDHTNLTEVPTRILKKNGQVNDLSLRLNQIEKMKKDDFKNGGNLQNLDLSNNPLSEIEMGAFENLKSIGWITITDTMLDSVDLAVFAGVGASRTDMVWVTLDNNPRLKEITVSSAEKFPSNAVISIARSGIETIDNKINDLLAQYPLITLSIANNIKLQCANLTWMAYWVLCNTGQVTVSNARCADQGNQLLTMYLNVTVPNACDSTIAPPTTSDPTTTSSETDTTVTGTTTEMSTGTETTAGSTSTGTGNETESTPSYTETTVITEGTGTASTTDAGNMTTPAKGSAQFGSISLITIGIFFSFLKKL